MVATAGTVPSNRTLPRLTLVLLAGAALHLVIQVATRTTMNSFLDLSVSAVISYVTGAMPLVLAASIVAGWDRWPSGRRWLVAAAIAYGLVAVVDGVGLVSTAVAWPPDPAEPNPPVTLVRVALLVTASLAAPLLAATGLWRHATPAPRLPLLAAAALVGAVVLAVQLLVIAPAFDHWREEPFLVSASMATALVPAAVAALGIAAVRAIPQQYVLPEGLIALGALASAGGSAATFAAVSLIGDAILAPWTGAVLTVSLGIALGGMACAALGFFTGRISAPGA